MSVTSTHLQKWTRRSSAAVVTALLLVLAGISCMHPHHHYPDELFYEDIAWGVIAGLDDIYYQNIAGTPSGYVDILACGPFGGTVHITGTTFYNHCTGIKTVHLRYDLSECRISSTSSSSNLEVDLTLNGVICEHSSWSHDYLSLCYDSPALWLAGSAQRGCEQREVDDMTDFWASSTNSGTSAELFGFNLSW